MRTSFQNRETMALFITLLIIAVALATRFWIELRQFDRQLAHAAIEQARQPGATAKPLGAQYYF